MSAIFRKGIFDVLLFVVAIFGLILIQPSIENSDLIILPFACLVFFRLLYLIYKKEIVVSKDILNFDKSRVAILWYLAFTAFAVFGLWIFSEHLVFPAWLRDDEIVSFLIVHALIQEIIFRSYLINRLKLLVRNHLYIALTSGILFSVSHLILPDTMLILPLTFVAGTVWSYLYIKYPNILYVLASHTIINLAVNVLYL